MLCVLCHMLDVHDTGRPPLRVQFKVNMTVSTVATALICAFLAPAAHTELHSVLKSAVAKQAIPAVVAMVATRNAVVYRQA
jgi:hypothetical protein